MLGVHRFSMEVSSMSGLMHEAHNGKLSAIIQVIARLYLVNPCIASKCYESWWLKTAGVGRVSWVPLPVPIGLNNRISFMIWFLSVYLTKRE